MRWSGLFIPTLRDAPADSEAPSNKLMRRAGYIRQLAAGGCGYLFLGQRALARIEGIVKEQMDALGAQQILLGPEFEAVAVPVGRGELRSYKQLPQIWYQIGPHSAVALSFDLDAEGLDATYKGYGQALARVFEHCGVPFALVEAHEGASRMQAIVIPCESGERQILRCRCGYGAFLESASSIPEPPVCPDPEGVFEPERFHTPGRKTIASVAEFIQLPETSQMKSLVMVADGQPVLVMLRGDHSLSETKFAAAVGARKIRTATADEIRASFGADPGSLGPVGAGDLRILADHALQGRRNMISGANRNDYHLRNVNPGRDFTPEYFDLRMAVEGEGCLRCSGRLSLSRSIAAARLGRHFPASTAPRVLAAGGEEIPVQMAFCRIEIDQILRAAVELFHDKDGIALPASIAPFQAVVTPVNSCDEAQSQAANQIYEACREMGINALLDDRDERPGVKFKDADLIGMPYRVTIGKKLPQGMVELSERRTRKIEDVAVAEAAGWLASKL